MLSGYHIRPSNSEELFKEMKLESKSEFRGKCRVQATKAEFLI